MKISKIVFEGIETLALVDGEYFQVLGFAELSEYFSKRQSGETLEVKARVPFDARKCRNPFGASTQTFCIGLNYKAHIIESGKATPEVPTIFGKFASSLVGPNEVISLPGNSNEVDWEIELGVVIGSECARVTSEEALHYVGGYTIVNDISMRDWQSRTNQWFQGKNFHKATPVAPLISTPDEVDHAKSLDLICSLNGQIMQQGNTSDLLFDVPYLISYISQFATLMPGDLILTGTPGGVGMSQNPKRFLKHGDILRSEIEGLGFMESRFENA